MEKNNLDIENINTDDEEGFIIVKFKRNLQEGEFKYYLPHFLERNYGYIEYIKFKDNHKKYDIYSQEDDELYDLIHKWVKENVKIKRKIVVYDLGLSEK